MDPYTDPLILWAMQGGQEKSYEDKGAVAVVASGLFNRNRIVVAGEFAAAQRLVDDALADYPDYIVIGDGPLIEGLLGVQLFARTVWMDIEVNASAPAVDTSDVAWVLDSEVSAVVSQSNPNSWVSPGDDSIIAWAGLHAVGVEGDRELVAVGALAHCAPNVAFLAGVTTMPAHRQQGLSLRVCAFLRDHGLRTRGTVALLADVDNIPAISMYTRLGFTYRPLAAARKLSNGWRPRKYL